MKKAKLIEAHILAMMLLRAEAKKKFEEADLLEAELIESMVPMEPVQLSNGMTAILKDNFVSGNVIFRVATCRQFEIVIK